MLLIPFNASYKFICKTIRKVSKPEQDLLLPQSQLKDITDFANFIA